MFLSEISELRYELMSMFLIWPNGSCGTDKRDEAGTEQPVLGSRVGQQMLEVVLRDWIQFALLH